MEDPSAIFPLDCHLYSSSLPEMVSERKLFLPLSPAPPHRRALDGGITRRQQHLRLMRFERLRRFLAFRPPLEAAFRQTLLRDPETLRVVDQYFDSRRAPATEQEQATRKR